MIGIVRHFGLFPLVLVRFPFLKSLTWHLGLRIIRSLLWQMGLDMRDGDYWQAGCSGLWFLVLYMEPGPWATEQGHADQIENVLGS